MLRNSSRLLYTVFAVLIVASASVFSWDYVETFTNHNAPSSTYGVGSFTGDNGYVWNYNLCRADAGYPINGKSIMFRAKATGYDPSIKSQAIPGGITDFKVSLRKGFTGGGLRSVSLYINGNFIASSTPYDVNNEIRTFEVNNINIPGDVVIELRNLGPQFVIDDLSWTIFGKPGIGEPTRVRIVKLIPDNPIQGIPFKAVVQLVDDENIPQKLSDNTAVELELREGNGNLSGNLSGVIPAGQTTVVFDNLLYSDEDIARIRAAAPNNKTGDAVFLRDLDNVINFLRMPVLSVNVYPYGHAGAVHPAILAEAIGEFGLPYVDFNGFNATLNISDNYENSSSITLKFDRGVASFNNVILSNVGEYSLSVDADYLGSSTANYVNVIPMPTMTDMIIPDYIKGDGSFLPQGNGRMPAYALVRFENLHPGIEYRFLSGSALTVPSTKPITPGNMIAYNPYTDTYFYPSTKDLANSNTSSTFISRSDYYGEGGNDGFAYVWISMVPTSNSEFAPGKDISWCVDLGTARGSAITRLYTTEKSRNLSFSTNCNSNPSSMTYATGIYDDASPATPKNFVVLYDENENPISTALVQVNGSVLQTPGFDHQTPAYYANFENNNGAFATMIPNNLSGGIKGIAEFTADGMLVNTWQDEDGIWAGYSTSDCGYGMNPPSSNSTEIQFQLPQISLLSPSYGMEVCNYPDDQLPVVFNARGIATINLWASINGGAYELIENNIDARNGYYLWDVPRGRFADANIQLWLEVPEYPEKSYESGIFRIYDSPVVTNQTPSMNYCVNTDVVLTTEAEGSLLTYQWYKDGKLLVDGANISGSRQAVLTIKNIRHNDAGVYKAYVYGHNNCPSARTESIAVYPARPISFVLPKNDITIGEVLGNIALLNFRVHVNGVEIESADFERYDVKVEWFRKVTETNSIKLVDNDRISGTLSDWLTIRNFQDSDQGVYFAVVTGLCGDATVSPLFTLVKVDITIDQQPQSQNLCLGNQLTLHGSASSSADEIITYQWYKNSSPLMNDVKISGVDTETLTINDISASDMGSYYLSATLSVSGQSINSDIAELTVDKFANIILQPDSVKTIVAGTQLSLEVMAEGNDSNEELLYQWYFNNVAIPDENLSILILDDAQAENSGEYYCVITNKCGALKSATSTVTVTPKQATDVSETFNSSFGLGVVNPNPAIDVARFTVSSAKTEVVSVKLIDELGNEISTIVNQVLSQGVYNYQIDITNLGLSNGTYFLLLQSIEGNLIQKFIVVR